MTESLLTNVSCPDEYHNDCSGMIEPESPVAPEADHWIGMCTECNECALAYEDADGEWHARFIDSDEYDFRIKTRKLTLRVEELRWFAKRWKTLAHKLRLRVRGSPTLQGALKMSEQLLAENDALRVLNGVSNEERIAWYWDVEKIVNPMSELQVRLLAKECLMRLAAELSKQKKVEEPKPHVVVKTLSAAPTCDECDGPLEGQDPLTNYYRHKPGCSKLPL